MIIPEDLIFFSFFVVGVCIIIFFQTYQKKSGRKDNSGKVLKEKLCSNSRGPPMWCKRSKGVVFHDCVWGLRNSFTQAAFRDLFIILKSGTSAILNLTSHCQTPDFRRFVVPYEASKKQTYLVNKSTGYAEDRGNKNYLWKG